MLSNFDFVTESLTLIAGKSSVPAFIISYRRCTPVVVSSVTPLIVGGDLRPAAGILLRFGVRSRSRMTPHSSGSFVSIERRDLAGLLELGALVHEERRVAAVIEQHVRAAAVGPHQRLLGAPPVLLERLALPREHRHALRILDGARCDPTATAAAA